MGLKIKLFYSYLVMVYRSDSFLFYSFLKDASKYQK